MNNSPIGIFDSGVGGLSILSEIQELLPSETSIFVADQAYVPYGAKSKEELIDRVGRIMQFFKEKKVKTVVAACNTATVYTIEEMRQKYDFPIIGTVPVVKTIAEITKSGKVAVFSTPATAKSAYLADLIQKFASNVSVTCVGGSNLEEMVENGEIDTPRTISVLREHLLPLINDGVDTIALGCTHYPFLRRQIEEIVGQSVAVVDSGGAVARRLNQVLAHENLLSTQKGQDLYYTTGEAGKFMRVAGKLLGREIQAERLNYEL